MIISNMIGCVEVYADEKQEYASYENIDGYGYITLEQWGCDPMKRIFYVSICHYNGDLEISEMFPVDISEGWNTMRGAYEKAAAFYNKYVPDTEVIPLF